MIAAIASGKGGTGKTTVSAALASVWAEALGRPVIAVDLDVEEPNLHLFLRPTITRTRPAGLEIPVVDPAVCTRCGACRTLCQFGAITILGDTPMVFADMCHGCGGCLAVCPAGAITAGTRELGVVEEGTAGDIGFLKGKLRVGEAMSPPLIRAVMHRLDEIRANDPDMAGRDILCDAPPGVSCPALAAVGQADCIVLVTEPTPFGIHDFKLAVEAFTPLGKPPRSGKPMGFGGSTRAAETDFCRIPFDAFCRNRAGLCPSWRKFPEDRGRGQGLRPGEGFLRDGNKDYIFPVCTWALAPPAGGQNCGRARSVVKIVGFFKRPKRRCGKERP